MISARRRSTIFYVNLLKGGRVLEPYKATEHVEPRIMDEVKRSRIIVCYRGSDIAFSPLSHKDVFDWLFKYMA